MTLIVITHRIAPLNCHSYNGTLKPKIDEKWNKED